MPVPQWVLVYNVPLSSSFLPTYLKSMSSSRTAWIPLALGKHFWYNSNCCIKKEKNIYTHTYIWRRQWHPTPVLLPGKSHGRRSLEGCSPWGRWGLDTTERLHFHFSLSCIGEGNGNALQCSCLENPTDGGAWWAAIYGVAQSWTWLKRLSSIHIYMSYIYIYVWYHWHIYTFII